MRRVALVVCVFLASSIVTNCCNAADWQEYRAKSKQVVSPLGRILSTDPKAMDFDQMLAHSALLMNFVTGVERIRTDSNWKSVAESSPAGFLDRVVQLHADRIRRINRYLAALEPYKSSVPTNALLAYAVATQFYATAIYHQWSSIDNTMVHQLAWTKPDQRPRLLAIQANVPIEDIIPAFDYVAPTNDDLVGFDPPDVPSRDNWWPDWMDKFGPPPEPPIEPPSRDQRPSEGFSVPVFKGSFDADGGNFSFETIFDYIAAFVGLLLSFLDSSG